MPIQVTAFTSIRSDYGPMRPVLKAMHKDPRFRLQLVVGGAHLSEKYGHSIDEIKTDGLSIAATIPFLDNSIHPAHVLSEIQLKLSSYFESNTGEILMMLGDRYELLAAASTALVMGVPIAHLSGGEVTQGAIDNQVRHSVTKMSHIHFPTTETYRDNLIQMGEEPWRICLSGEPALDEILSQPLLPRDLAFKKFKLDVSQDLVLGTFHPETIYNQITTDFIDQVLAKISERPHTQVLLTASNFDHQGDQINDLLRSLPTRYKNVKFQPTLGQLNYYSILKHAKVVIGNSSSGLIEAQSFNTPVVNIGKRQEGRLANANVVHAEATVEATLGAIDKACSDAFRQTFNGKKNIFGDGQASNRILDFLNDLPKDSLLKKIDAFQNGNNHRQRE